ncbi:hypothetical protein Dda_1082 [Drechslerella dactyloides]|uniref:Uncharacterized protein n=1 Tax=Drechslerella dactyloides TaxID=74499 RepID=A0AAD6J5P1_DREDA|nr:hypothetical protein Dda_1082 [Drechslerella dactyloides]
MNSAASVDTVQNTAATATTLISSLLDWQSAPSSHAHLTDVGDNDSKPSNSRYSGSTIPKPNKTYESQITSSFETNSAHPSSMGPGVTETPEIPPSDISTVDLAERPNVSTPDLAPALSNPTSITSTLDHTTATPNLAPPATIGNERLPAAATDAQLALQNRLAEVETGLLAFVTLLFTIFLIFRGVEEYMEYKRRQNMGHAAGYELDRAHEYYRAHEHSRLIPERASHWSSEPRMERTPVEGVEPNGDQIAELRLEEGRSDLTNTTGPEN